MFSIINIAALAELSSLPGKQHFFPSLHCIFSYFSLSPTVRSINHLMRNICKNLQIFPISMIVFVFKSLMIALSLFLSTPCFQFEICDFWLSKLFVDLWETMNIIWSMFLNLPWPIPINHFWSHIYFSFFKNYRRLDNIFAGKGNIRCSGSFVLSFIIFLWELLSQLFLINLIII